MKKLQELDVFKLAHEIAIEIYKITGLFPEEEKYGLLAQMRKSASSICTNLMEGSHRCSKNEFKYFISISKGSCGELKYQLLLAKDLGYIKVEIYEDLIEKCERISMMLTRLHQSLK